MEENSDMKKEKPAEAKPVEEINDHPPVGGDPAENKGSQEKKEDSHMALGMCLGMGLGACFGQVLFKNLALGMSLGMLFGMTIGICWGKTK